MVQMAGRTSSNTLTYTETSAATVARNAPEALSNSVTSTLGVSSKCESAYDLPPNRLPTVSLPGRQLIRRHNALLCVDRGPTRTPIERQTPRR